MTIYYYNGFSKIYFMKIETTSEVIGRLRGDPLVHEISILVVSHSGPQFRITEFL